MYTIRKFAAALSVAALVVGPLSALAAPGGPAVTLTSSAPFIQATPTNVTWASPIPFSVSLSSSTTNFDAADIQVVGGSVQNFAGSDAAYTFSVKPGDGDPSHDTEPRYVQVQINADQFDGNQASQSIAFWYDPSQAPVDTTAPVVTITQGPTDGSTQPVANASSSAAIHFEFTVDDASSTVRCSIVDASSTDSFFGCGSPQDYALPVGNYRFVVQATDQANNIGSSTRSFMVAVSSTTATTTSDTGGSSSGSAGGGTGSGPTLPNGGGIAPNNTGNGMIVGSGPIAPGSPGGSFIPTGSGVFVNPNPPIIPTTAGNGGLSPLALAPAPATVASRSSLAAVPRSGARLTATTQTPSGDLSNPASSTDTSQSAIAEDQNASSTLLQGQGAAVATAGASSAVWFWGIVVLLALAVIGWLLYRSA